MNKYRSHMFTISDDKLYAHASELGVAPGNVPYGRIEDDDLGIIIIAGNHKPTEHSFRLDTEVRDGDTHYWVFKASKKTAEQTYMYNLNIIIFDD